MSNAFFKEAAELQKRYQALVDGKKLSKKDMCDLCVPFRDKYRLTDLQVLKIARREMGLSEMVLLAENTDQWTGVEDKLPEKEGDYLCIIVDYIGETRMEVHTLVKWANCYDWAAHMSSFWRDHNTITHWMPLPKPPTTKGGAG